MTNCLAFFFRPYLGSCLELQGANDIFGLAEHATGLGLAENKLAESWPQR